MSEHILIVDDDPGVLEVLRAMLVELRPNCTLATATTGIGAIDAVDGRRPDLVLLDLNMPEMNGLEALRELKRRDRTLPVLAVTAADHGVAAQALRDGALGYIPKPFNAQYIAQLVDLAVAAGRPRAHERRPVRA